MQLQPYRKAHNFSKAKGKHTKNKEKSSKRTRMSKQSNLSQTTNSIDQFAKFQEHSLLAHPKSDFGKYSLLPPCPQSVRNKTSKSKLLKTGACSVERKSEKKRGKRTAVMSVLMKDKKRSSSLKRTNY